MHILCTTALLKVLALYRTARTLAFGLFSRVALLHAWEADPRDKRFTPCLARLGVPRTAACRADPSRTSVRCTRADAAGASPCRSRSTRSLVRGTLSQQSGRRGKLSQRARESSDGVQQQKASCGANPGTARMWSSSGTMPATPTGLARLDPAAYIMFTACARRLPVPNLPERRHVV